MKYSKGAYENYVMDSSYAIFPQKNRADDRIRPDEMSVSSKNGILNKVFKDKFDTLKITLFDIVYELNNRSALDLTLTKKINEDICRLRTQLFELESYSIGSNQSVDKRRGALEDKIHELEKELRNQDIKRWQDIVILKKELRTAFREYRDLKRKFVIIEEKS